MKKMFFYAAVASVALVSCSKDPEVLTPSNENEANEAQAIEFKLRNNIEVATRSTGAVGDTVNVADNKNVWNNQELNVFMFEKGTFNLAQEVFYVGDVKTERAIFDDAKLIAPKGSDSGDADYGLEAKYFPATGAYDFFAYYDDDASTHTFDSTSTTGIMTMDVTINGAQDLMVAKAIPSAQDSAKYTAPTGEDKGARFYSAYTARRGVQPVLTFEHLLTRLVFHVSSDSARYCDDVTGIMIDSIAIENIPNIGNMTVAYTGEKPTQLIDWTNDDATLWLQERKAADNDTVKKLVSTHPKWDTGKDTVRIGESLLIPTQDEYDLVIYYSQKPNADLGTEPAGWNDAINGTWDDYKNRVYKSELRKTIKAKNNKPGTQYNVFFNVFGLEKIEIDVKLTGWETGEDIDVDNDEW